MPFKKYWLLFISGIFVIYIFIDLIFHGGNKYSLLEVIFSVLFVGLFILPLFNKEAKNIIKMAEYDRMTNLYRREKFMELIEREISRSKRYKRIFSFVLLDLDNFKKMNDTFGHDYGDRVLIFLGKVLNEHKRKEDIAGRFGGEEFTLFFPETESLGALNYINKVQSEFRKYNNEKGFTISAGIAQFPKDGGNFNEIYKNADSKLYKAKETKNSVVI